ncbi:MAG: hypothetical protein AAB875_03450 [Patescibacteria group bacterium]
MLRKALQLFFKDNTFLSIFLILLGTVTWSITMVKSGLVYSYGMGFWGPNGHDGVWHIALAESLSRGSREMPVFSGETLKNYHVGFDLLLAFLHKLTTIPISTLYFQIIPPILALLLGLLTYKFVTLWRKSKEEAFWATFFVYFGGSFGWLVTLIRGGGLGGESMFWSQQSVSTLINPPFALSLVLLLTGLILLLKKKNLLLSILCFGILIQIKAYAGALALGGLFMAGIYNLWKGKDRRLLKVFLGSLIVSLLLFLPFNKNSGNLVVFKPFWFLETMMGLTDRLGWLRFHSAMTNYRLGNIWVKTTPTYLVAFAIFWVGNMGTRMVKEIIIWKWIKNLKKVGWIEVFITAVITAGGAIPMFFLQAGTPWNTIQFFYYSLMFSGILAGIVVGEVLSKTPTLVRRTVLAASVILLTIPTTIGTLNHYLPQRPPAKISNEELEALSYLSKEPQGTVLTFPFDRDKAKEAEANPPRPLYLYESTAYVSALAKKTVFLEDEVNLDITGYPWGERKVKVGEFLKSPDAGEARAFLRENDISYIYWIKGQRALLGEGQLGITKIFENDEVDIFKVD